MSGCWARSALEVSTRGLTAICTRSLRITEFCGSLAENQPFLARPFQFLFFLFPTHNSTSEKRLLGGQQEHAGQSRAPQVPGGGLHCTRGTPQEGALRLCVPAWRCETRGRALVLTFAGDAECVGRNRGLWGLVNQ